MFRIRSRFTSRRYRIVMYAYTTYVFRRPLKCTILSRPRLCIVFTCNRQRTTHAVRTIQTYHMFAQYYIHYHAFTVLIDVRKVMRKVLDVHIIIIIMTSTNNESNRRTARRRRHRLTIDTSAAYYTYYCNNVVLL